MKTRRTSAFNSASHLAKRGFVRFAKHVQPVVANIRDYFFAEMDYVPEEYSKQVSDYLQNFQQVRQALEKICNINRELLRRRVKF